MLKITRVAEKERTMLIVSGRVDAEQLPELRRFLEAERENKLALDLAEVSLVDADVVRFLRFAKSRESGLNVARRMPANGWSARSGRNKEDERTTAQAVKNIVLVHGGFVDGFGWQGVYDLPKKAATRCRSSKIQLSHWRTTSPSPCAHWPRRTAR